MDPCIKILPERFLDFADGQKCLDFHESKSLLCIPTLGTSTTALNRVVAERVQPGQNRVKSRNYQGPWARSVSMTSTSKRKPGQPSSPATPRLFTYPRQSTTFRKTPASTKKVQEEMENATEEGKIDSTHVSISMHGRNSPSSSRCTANTPECATARLHCQGHGSRRD